MRQRIAAAALTVGVLIALAAPAWAHAELTVESVPAGTTQSLELEVAEERAGDATTMIEIQVPPELTSPTCGEKAGWTCAVDTAGDQPVITFTRSDPAAENDLHYPFTVTTPAEPGTFTLPTVQTYDSGTIVQWIGPEDAEEPAPVLLVQGEVVPAAPEEEEAAPAPGATPAPTPAPSEDHDHEAPAGGAETGGGGTAGGSSARLPLILVGVGALVGAAAVLPRRRRA